MHSDIVLDDAKFAGFMAVPPTGNTRTHLAEYTNRETVGNALKRTPMRKGQ
jgi:hypothetical protein